MLTGPSLTRIAPLYEPSPTGSIVAPGRQPPTRSRSSSVCQVRSSGASTTNSFSSFRATRRKHKKLPAVPGVVPAPPDQNGSAGGERELVRRHGQPVPRVDRGDGEEELGELGLVEVGPGLVVDVVADAVGPQLGHGVGEAERRALPCREEGRLLPRREREQPLRALARGQGVARVQLDAVRAAVEDGGANPDELAQGLIELDDGIERGHRLVRIGGGAARVESLLVDDGCGCVDVSHVRIVIVVSVSERKRKRPCAGAGTYDRRTAATRVSPLLEPGRLGPVETRNRIVRAGTSESASGFDGA